MWENQINSNVNIEKQNRTYNDILTHAWFVNSCRHANTQPICDIYSDLCIGDNPQPLQDAFAAMDANGDGVLSREAPKSKELILPG